MNVVLIRKLNRMINNCLSNIDDEDILDENNLNCLLDLSIDQEYDERLKELFMHKEEINDLLERIFQDRTDSINLNQLRKLNINEKTFNIIFKYLINNNCKFSDEYYFTNNVSMYLDDLTYYPLLEKEEQEKLLKENYKYVLKINHLKLLIIKKYYDLIDELAQKYMIDENCYKNLVRCQICYLNGKIDKKRIDEKTLEKELNTLCKSYMKSYNSDYKGKNNNFDFDQYTKETNEENKNLDDIYDELYKIKEERKEIVNYITEHNLRLVVSVAKYYINRGVSYEDLIQIGNLGLMKTLDKYDPDKASFSTYAMYWIKQCIKRALEDQGRSIRVPSHFHEIIYKYKVFYTNYYNKNNVAPTEEEILKELDITKEKLATIKYYLTDITSLSEPIGEAEHGVQNELGDYIKDENTNIEETAVNNILQEDIMSILNEYRDREKAIIILYYGIVLEKPIIISDHKKIILLTKENITDMDAYLKENFYKEFIELKNNVYEFKYIHLVGKEMTLNEIGGIFNLTRERVRQIKGKTLQKLRSLKNRQKLNY